MYSEMKEGLGRLYLMLEGFESKEILANGDIVTNKKQRKPKVKLFRASQAANFVVYNDNMIFSLIKSTSVTDKQNFQINKFSPLAKSFTDNFDNLFKNHNTTMDFYDYMKVTIISGDNDKEEINDLIWGPDSGSHHIPVYISISSKEHKLSEERNSGKPLILKHNKEISWVSIQKINEEDKKNRDFAINRILGNYYSTFDDESAEWEKKFDCINGREIYKIIPNHKNKIRLEQGNYVKKHLEERGYCYTPSTMYDVYLGLTLNKTLPDIYNVFTEFDKENLEKYSFYNNNTTKQIDGKEVRISNRIIWSFFCEIEKAEIRVGEYNAEDREKVFRTTKEDVWQNLKDMFEDKEKVKDKDLYNHEIKPDILCKAKSFVISTIKADIDFILGKYSEIGDLKNIRDNTYRFLVHFHFIRGKVINDNLELDFQADGYEENKADFIVIHSLGKKNITGGFSELLFEDNVNQNDKIIIRRYNLSNPLDSLYYCRQWKNKKIKLISNNISFSSFEAAQNMKKDKEREKEPKTDNENINNNPEYNQGFRNLICLEFIKIT